MREMDAWNGSGVGRDGRALRTGVVRGRGAASLLVPGRRPSCRRMATHGKRRPRPWGSHRRRSRSGSAHPQWQLELDRWRELAEAPLDRKQLRLKLESVEASIEALEHLREIMGGATKRVRTSSGLKEEPDWATRLKACRLVLAAAVAAVPELGGQASQAPVDRRTLRIVP